MFTLQSRFFLVNHRSKWSGGERQRGFSATLPTSKGTQKSAESQINNPQFGTCDVDFYIITHIRGQPKRQMQNHLF
jgi:hypothetical protein